MFSFTRENEGINVNDALVITLDQQYYGGPGVVVLAPYENEGNNVSDALACAIEKEFSEDGIKMDGIFCGRTGYSNASKTGSNRVPTSTESSIDKDRDTIFTTICFGTKTPNQKVVADGICLHLYGNGQGGISFGKGVSRASGTSKILLRTGYRRRRNQHFAGSIAHSQNLITHLIDSHNAGLLQHYTLTLDKDKDIGGTKIYTYIHTLKHFLSPVLVFY